jgi:DNA repair exonuclease SbcCD ATPase subunit
VLITGDNQDEDTFESNGSGKSTFFSETLTWGFFGQTIRGLKADSVINRKVGKNARVCIQLIDDVTGDVYEITRHRKHAQHGNHVLLFRNEENITGKSDTDTTAMIEEIIGMDYLTFTNSVMFGQGITKLFASTTDAEQKKILEQMLQIDIFRLAQEKAKEKVDGLNTEINGLESDLNKDRGIKANWEQQVEELQAKEAELGEKTSARITELEAELDGYQTEIDALEHPDDLVSERATLERLVPKAKERVDSFKEFEDQRNELVGLQKSAMNEGMRLKRKAETDTQKLHDIRNGKNIPKSCETCGQALPLDDTSHIEKHLEDAIAKSKTELESQRQEIGTLEGLIEKSNKRLEGKPKAENDLQDINWNILQINSEIKQIQNKRKSLDDSINRTHKLIQEQIDLMNTTYTSVIEDTLFKIKNIDGCIEIHEKEVAEKEVERDKYKFWVEAYGNQGIKSVLLDSVTPFLNERCNYYLTKLAGNSIEVTFNTQQEVKSGANKGQKKDKFKVDVDNKNGDEGYDGNSGGEKRRVDIAINMALQDLVLSRTSKKLDLIVYDECFEGLDGIGCENVIQLLKEKASQCGTIMVITHNDSLKQLFSKSVRMIKSAGKTAIEEDMA